MTPETNHVPEDPGSERERIADIEPTDEEVRWIKSLRRCLKRAPSTVWIYVGDGSINVMRLGADGSPAMAPCGHGDLGVDQGYVLDSHFPGAPHADGGGW